MKKPYTALALWAATLLFPAIFWAQSTHHYEIRFPKDAQADCAQPSPDTIWTEEIANCDLLAVSVHDEFFSASGQECYKILRIYRVINWCEYDGQSPPVIVSRDEDCDGIPGDEDVWVLVRPNGTVYFDRDNLEGNNTPNAFTKGTACDGLSNPAGHWVNSTIKPAIASRGFWQYAQYIKVYDHTDPVISVVSPTPFCSYDSPTAVDPVCEGPVSIAFSVSEVCTPDDVTIKAFLDIFNDGTFPYDHSVRLNPNGTRSGSTQIFNILGSYPDYTLVSTTPQGLPIGLHQFEIHAEDGCGNVAAVHVTIEVRDCKAPAPICHNGLTLTLMPIDTDNDGLPDQGMAEVWASDFIASPVVDCTPPIRYSIRREGQQPDINRISLVFDCEDYDSAGGSDGNQLVVFIDAWDGAGNRDFCETYILLQDQSGACPGPVMGSISGMLRRENGAPVQGMEVQVLGGMQQNNMTNNSGQYLFEQLPAGQSYTVEGISTFDYPFDCVSTFDLILIQRHILGIQPLNSPYKIIAADVNRSGTVTILDMILLQMEILAIQNPAEQLVWRFIPADYEFPNPANPWSEVFPEQIDFEDLWGNHPDQDFIVIRVGDVTNCSTPDLNDIELRNAPENTLWLDLPDATLNANEMYTVAFKSNDLSRASGFQFGLEFNDTQLSLADIEYNILESNNIRTSNTSKDLINVSWVNPQPGRAFTKDEVLFRLVFFATTNGRLSDLLHLSGRGLNIEAYNHDLQSMGIALRFGGQSLAPDRFELYQNKPNPVHEMTSIGFYLPRWENVVLTISDLQGRVVLSKSGSFEQGYNEFTFSAEELPVGVLQYTLSTDTNITIRRMVVVK
ncbi:MAG: hypothetical protein KAX50_00515 [Saprospiraceae bacterium]|nr:hypothetical protein [Saprospiraceae bacterium]